MSDTTTIEWTQATWNPTVGCDRISPGCANCYAKTLHDMRHKAFLAGKKMAPQYAQPFEVLQLLDSRLEAPLRRKKPTTYFVNSVSDLFHADVPDAFIDQVFAVMALAPQHTFQILTKRADRMRNYMTRQADGWGRAARIAEASQHACGFDGEKYDTTKAMRISRAKLVLPDGNVFWIGACNPPDQPYKERWILKTWPLPNVWLGVSVENQRFADERIPLLLQTPAAVRFISAEPLLGSIELKPYMRWRIRTSGWNDEPDHVAELPAEGGSRGLDWVIVGGESGAGARPFGIGLARSIVRQCRAAGVAVFVKQLGDLPVMTESAWRSGQPLRLLSARDSNRVAPGIVPLKFYASKAGNPEEWPDDLRVREFPVVAQ